MSDDVDVLDLTTRNPTQVAKQKPESRKKSPRRGSAAYVTVPLPPCKVCDGHSTGYHFGVITCEACKAFFRRALLQKQDYKCINHGNCTTFGKKLGNCSACRLRKCLGLGMSKGGVRKGRYSIAIRTKAIIEAKASEGKEAAPMAPTRLPYTGTDEQLASLPRDSGVTMDALDGLLQLSGAWTDTATTVSLADILNPMSSVNTTSTIHSLASSGSQPKPQMDILLDALIACQEAVYPDLMKIHQQTILDVQQKIHTEQASKQEAFGELFGSSNTISSDEYKQVFSETGIDLDDRLAHFNAKGKSMEEAISQYVNFAKLIPGFNDLNPKDVSNLLKASHLEFWMIGNHMLFNKELEVALSWDNTHNSNKKEISKFWPSEWVDQVFKFADRFQKLKLSVEEIALIRVIILTYTDRCNLIDGAQIQNLQEKYLECLHYHLMRTHKNYNRRLYKIFDILLAIRDFTDMNLKVNRMFLEQWNFVIHEFPLWKEMLSFIDEL